MSEYDHCLITFLTGHNGSTETFINATATQKGLNSDQFNWTSEKIRPPHTVDLTLIHQTHILLLLVWHRVALKHSADQTDLRLLHSVYNSCPLGINQQLLGNFLIVWSQPMGKYYTNVSQLATSHYVVSLVELSKVHRLSKHMRKDKWGAQPLYISLIILYLCGTVFSDKNSCLLIMPNRLGTVLGFIL